MNNPSFSKSMNVETFLTTTFKNINLIESFQNVKVGDSTFYRTLRRLINRLPIDASLCIFDKKIPLISMGGYTLAIEYKKYDVKRTDKLTDAIAGEVIDVWPDALCRSLTRINFGEGVLLQLSPDGSEYHTTSGWRARVQDGEVLLCAKAGKPNTYLELTIRPFEVTTQEKTFMLGVVAA